MEKTGSYGKDGQLWKRRAVIETVMAYKGDGREVGFQDGGCFSRFLKRVRINNYTFITFLNCG